MHCEFCNSEISTNEPANVALLQHLEQNRVCHEQYNFLLGNIRSSWVATCSGGA